MAISDIRPQDVLSEDEKAAWKAGIKRQIALHPQGYVDAEELYDKDWLNKDLQRRVTYWRDRAVGWYDDAKQADWHVTGTAYVHACIEMAHLAMRLSDSYRQDAEEAV